MLMAGHAKGEAEQRVQRAPRTNLSSPGNICDGGFWALDNSRPKVKRQCVDGSNSPVAPSRCVHGQPCGQKARLQHRHPDGGGMLPLQLGAGPPLLVLCPCFKGFSSGTSGTVHHTSKASSSAVDSLPGSG